VNLVPDATFGTDAATGNSIFRERQVQVRYGSTSNHETRKRD